MKNICQKIIIIMLVVILSASTNISFAVTQEEINQQKEEQSQINSQIDEIEEKQKQIEAEKSEAMKQVESLGQQINNYESQIDELDKQIEDANEQIQEQEEKLRQAEEDYKEKEETIKKRLVAIYQSGEVSYLDFLLSSSSITEFLSSYYLVSEITQMDIDLLDKIEQEKQEIENAKQEIENKKQELTVSKSEKESLATQLKAAKSEKDEQVSKLSEEDKALEEEIQELQVANQQLANQIKEAEKKYAEQLAKLNNNATTITGSGYFIRPISGGTITANGYYSSGKFHGAIDYGVNSGTPVYAAADGVVMVTANKTTSYGTYVVIRHANGMQSYYAHGTYGSICVSPGETVKQGQQIMLSGSTGNSSGPHLHFEVRKSPYNYNGYATAYGQDSRVDPSAYM